MWAQQTTEPTWSLMVAHVMLITGDPLLYIWPAGFHRNAGLVWIKPAVKQWNSFEKPQT